MSHYFDSPTGPAGPLGSVELQVGPRALTLRTAAGVFARDGLDKGTAVLLDEAPPPPTTGHLLDLGCGYGPIALTLAARSPGATVWAVDVNERARELCAANAEEAGLGNVRVVDDVPEDVRFAAIWSNPPIRIGKQALHELLLRWLPRLSDDGVALMVVQKNLGSDSLQRWLTENGWPTERLTSRNAFRVLRTTRGAPAPTTR
ncbi:class I SAM-dependent methyltransferase [Pseudonocardia sp. CA-107938]|uniref:class I SAM-dependent methyltransferase n=1 Tax=Pseudonocardia sp. CA-107938 TaxID=3240021 RepID=UPI003D8B2E8E